MTKVAVILSGCGHQDGSEIRESVITLYALDKAGATVDCFAPNKEQSDVVNHLTNSPTNEKRNVLVESARIARGKIKDLQEADANSYDALILPGGFGAAKNLSTVANAGKNAEVIPELKKLITKFLQDKKPIGVICISPAVLVVALKNQVRATVTLGDDNDGMIESLGGNHEICATNEIVFDEANNIVSCSAYMREDSLANIGSGIEKLVAKVVGLTKK